MASDDAYYRHLCQGEIKGAHTFVTANLILRQVKSPGWQPKDWLDVGSGSGFLVAELKKIGIDSVGVEPGGWGQISARDKGISIVNGLLTEGTFNKRFDAVSATDVIEHQPDPKPMIRLMKRYMNDNGKMFLSFPFGDSLPAKIRKGKWKMVVPPTHCNFFTYKSFSRLADNCDLKIERFYKYSSSGFRGWKKLGLSLSTANRLMDAVSLGDQALVVLSLRNSTDK
ncbi:MAG: class I SAM-dependent methyltransferase [Verrucomicrobia bacterium]|nr:class I SAM-dependent methyltransferase [Verrucomicrobiota bacterium]